MLIRVIRGKNGLGAWVESDEAQRIHFFLQDTYKRLALGQTGGNTLPQMFYHQNYPLASGISALKAGRSVGVGQEGRLESDGLAIMNSGPVHLCGIKGIGDAFTGGSVVNRFFKATVRLLENNNTRPDPIS